MSNGDTLRNGYVENTGLEYSVSDGNSSTSSTNNNYSSNGSGNVTNNYYIDNSTNIDNSVNNVTYNYTYSGGNRVISNYAPGQRVNLASDFTGISFDDSNFYVNSSSGSLRIADARGKFIDYGGANGNYLAYSYLGNSGGVGGADILTGGEGYDEFFYVTGLVATLYKMKVTMML